MAKSYPKSEFVGFNYHNKSIETAKLRARENGVGDRIRFEVAKAKDYPGRDYDFVTFFDCTTWVILRAHLSRSEHTEKGWDTDDRRAFRGRQA